MKLHYHAFDIWFISYNIYYLGHHFYDSMPLYCNVFTHNAFYFVTS